MIGVSMEPIALGPAVMFGMAGHSLLGHLGYRKRHLDELITLVRTGRLDVSGSISEVLPLEDVARGVGAAGQQKRATRSAWLYGPDTAGIAMPTALGKCHYRPGNALSLR